jgi:hypothetical protein
MANPHKGDNLKRLFIFSLIAIGAIAETISIKESPDRVFYYEVAREAQPNALQAAQKPNRYYLFGDPNMERVSTGYLIVSFATEIDVEAFCAKYELKNPRKISRKLNTWVFENAGDLDDLRAAARIGDNETNVLYAKPDWLATAKLQ